MFRRNGFVRGGFRIALLGAAFAVAALGPGATVAQAKPCGDVRAAGETWVVGGDGATCKFQRRWTERYLEDGDEPRGWNCEGRSNPGSGGCNENGGPGFFVFYPPH